MERSLLRNVVRGNCGVLQCRNSYCLLNASSSLLVIPGRFDYGTTVAVFLSCVQLNAARADRRRGMKRRKERGGEVHRRQDSGRGRQQPSSSVFGEVNSKAASRRIEPSNLLPICIYTYTYIRGYIYTHIRIHVRICIYTYVRVYISTVPVKIFQAFDSSSCLYSLFSVRTSKRLSLVYLAHINFVPPPLLVCYRYLRAVVTTNPTRCVFGYSLSLV